MIQVAREELIEAVHLLALSAEGQLRALPSYVVVTDELALTFGDQYDVSVPSGAFGEILSRINQRFDEADPGDPFWRQEALFSDPRWQEIREMARSALELVGITPRAPDLGFITFVGGPS